MAMNSLFNLEVLSPEQLVQDAREKVRWAAEPVIPGQSIGAQILAAQRELQLEYGIVRRAWYGICGPETYRKIYQAWTELVRKRHALLAQSRGRAVGR